MQPSLSRLACVAFLLALPIAAAAQQPATSFDQLGALIHPGDTARIIEAGGHEVHGLVIYLSPSELVLQVAGARRTFLEADVERIKGRWRDPLANGALWGGAAGAGLSMLAGVSAVQRHDRAAMGKLPYFASVGFLGGLVGASSGALIDGLHAGERVVYSTHGVSSKVTLRPILAADRQGILAALTFGR